MWRLCNICLYLGGDWKFYATICGFDAANSNSTFAFIWVCVLNKIVIHLKSSGQLKMLKEVQEHWNQ